MRQQFWFNNPHILFENYHVFFPHKNYSLVRNLNAIVRLFIYYTILCIILTDNDLFTIIKPLLLVSFISVIVYKNNNTETFKNKEVVSVIRTCNKNNPVMNLSVMDYGSNKNIKIDKTLSNEEINDCIVGDFQYEDGGSNKKMLERSFYTMPVTNLYNDQTEFAKWLYDTGPTCKENTILCSNTITDRISMGNNS